MCTFPASALLQPKWPCKDYPECKNDRGSPGAMCGILSIDLTDGTHAQLLAWNRTDKFMNKLNEHFADIPASVCLLASKAEFHICGDHSDAVVPTLMDIPSRIQSRFDIMRRLLFLYPGFARKINLGWKKGERGPCKCHPTTSSKELLTNNDSRPFHSRGTVEYGVQPQYHSNFLPPVPNNGGYMQYNNQLAPAPRENYVYYGDNVPYSSLLTSGDIGTVGRRSYSQNSISNWFQRN